VTELTQIGVTDARGRPHVGPARRIVSLVPSWTELFFELGAADRVVGVTEYCVHPGEARRRCAQVGGTKTPDLASILALCPDLVVANREENRKLDVERLEREGAPVFVSYARTVIEAAREIRELGRLVGAGVAAERIALEVEAELALGPFVTDPICVAALIWKNPYMAIGGDCFANDLLSHCGARNPFVNAPRRYPHVSVAELCAARPEVVLLPTEPYVFDEADRRELLALDCPAARTGRVEIIEGELLTWYGPRIPRALRTLRRLLAQG